MGAKQTQAEVPLHNYQIIKSNFINNKLYGEMD